MDILTIFNIVSGVTAIASTIAALFPAPKEGSKWSKVRKAIDVAALNVKNAKNANTVNTVIDGVKDIANDLKKLKK